VEKPLRISILDQSPIAEGMGAGEALGNSIDLAKLADQLGYYRYWVAEHHATLALACGSPEVLMGPIAAATRDIRVGSGGIMLPHYSAVKVAESFSMLSAMYPGRIDLGLGRAAGSSPNIALALQRDRRQPPPDDFVEQLEELLTLLENRWPDTGAFPSLAASRMQFSTPEPWLLGSSQDSHVWAAEQGLPYCFADFINPHRQAITRHYKLRFQPCERMAKPRVGVAVWALCADTDAEASRLALPFKMMMLMLYGGQSIRVPDPEKAYQYLAEQGPVDVQPVGRRVVVGTPERVKASLAAIAESYEADELFVVNVMHDHGARRRSYELLAQAFDLKPEMVSAHQKVT
jgi:luciferase family oxidoreductase group 1